MVPPAIICSPQQISMFKMYDHIGHIDDRYRVYFFKRLDTLYDEIHPITGSMFTNLPERYTNGFPNGLDGRNEEDLQKLIRDVGGLSIFNQKVGDGAIIIKIHYLNEGILPSIDVFHSDESIPYTFDRHRVYYYYSSTNTLEHVYGNNLDQFNQFLQDIGGIDSFRQKLETGEINDYVEYDETYYRS
jgi:hypothetical protein